MDSSKSGQSVAPDLPWLILLTELDLATRWSCSIKKLQADRLKGVGIPYVKIGRLVRYRIEDVLEFEAAQLRQSTSEGGVS